MIKIIIKLFYVLIISTLITSCSLLKPTIVVDEEAQELVKLKVVSCYGESATGDVNLIISAKAKKDAVMEMGSYLRKIEAYDKDGNLYVAKELIASGKIGEKDLPAGIPIKFEYAFTDVPKNVKKLKLVKAKCYIKGPNGKVSGDDVMKIQNIPIEWDIEQQ